MSSTLIKKIIATNSCYAEIFESKGKIYTFLNPVSYLTAIKNEELFLQFDGIFVDGILLVLAIKMLYQKYVKRCSFDMTALAPKLFHYCETYGKTIYIVASSQEDVDRSVEIFRQRYPQLNIVGYRNGFFSDLAEIECEIKKIVALSPNFVICGMGIIKQEKFLERLKRFNFDGVAFTCGGFISQTAKGGTMYYPKIFDLLNIRFLYRMIYEKHTRKRYVQAFFCFPIQFVKERFRTKRSENLNTR